MKKKKLKQNRNNNNGIDICDSIVMSVKKKRVNLRRLEGILIALMGYSAVIISFLRMFPFDYNGSKLFLACTLLSVGYIIITVNGKKASWVNLVSILIGCGVCFRHIDSIAAGFRFVYNIIYKTSYHTEISYYKFLDPMMERKSVTVFFIAAAWLIAAVIYTFTIYHPNPILPILVTFPIIEVGLYNGIELPLLPGVSVVAYWLALFAMSSIDMGEYSGGIGGFVRKENLFFPKRQMRLKVTEKCGVLIIATVMLTAGATVAALRLTGYHRSDEINRKRIEIRDAVNSFSFSNVADSISNITQAFGFTFKYENHKLGNVDHLRYKNTVDLTVTMDRSYDRAIYLKEYTGSVYDDNSWNDLISSRYGSALFGSFTEYGIYPQDFPYKFAHVSDPLRLDYTLWIKSRLKGNRSFSPYGTAGVGDLVYNHDAEVSSKKQSSDEYSYKFIPTDAEAIAPMLGYSVRNVYSTEQIADDYWREEITAYCREKDLLSYEDFFTMDSPVSTDAYYLYNNPENLMAELLQAEYKDFVYDNYLQVPLGTDMDEVRLNFADILDNVPDEMSAYDKISLLVRLRDRIASMVTYSLDPGKTPGNRDFVNYFLIENKKGYCTHYATSGVILARMAGIPARYASGYVVVGDDFTKSSRNSDGTYTIDIHDNRSHAWAEIYLDGYGWVPFEFTAGYSSQTIDTTPATTTDASSAPSTETTTTAAGSTESHQSTTRATGRNHSRTSVTTTVTTVTVTAAAEVGGRHGGDGRSVPVAIVSVLKCIGIAALITALICLRRRIILHLRQKHFTTGAARNRIGYMFGYAEDLLELNKDQEDNTTLEMIANNVEKRLGGRYFTEGDFKELFVLALNASFGKESPSEEEVEKCRDTVEKIAAKKNEVSTGLKRLWLKYIKVLI